MPVTSIVNFWNGDAGELTTLGSGASVQNTTTFGLETGEYALKQAVANSIFALPSNQTIISTRFLFKFPAAPAGDTEIWVHSATTGLRLVLTSSRTLKVKDSPTSIGLTDTAGSTVLSTNTNYTIFISYDLGAGGIVKVWLGDSLEIDTTHSSDAGTIGQVRLGGAATTNEYFFGHIICTNTTAKVPDGHSIAKQLVAGTPTYDAWTKSAGSDAYALWNDTPYNSADYCIATAAAAQTAHIPDFSEIGASDTINAVQVKAWGKRTNGSGTTHSLRLRYNSTDNDDTVDPGTSDTFLQGGVYTPTLTQLNAGEAGGVRSAGGRDFTIFDVWVVADFTPASTQTISPTGFQSSGTYGTIALNRYLTPSGFQSTVTAGTTAPELNLVQTGFQSTVTSGTPLLTLDIAPSGFQSTVTMGSLMFNPLMTGFQSTVSSGTPLLTLDIAPSGFQSTVSAGTPALNLDITTTGFQVTNTFGTPLLTLDITPTGVAVTVTAGTPAVTTAGGTQTINTTGFSIGPTFGTPLLTLDIATTGFQSTVSFGNLMFNPLMTGFQSTVSAGTPLLTLDIAPSGFQSIITAGTPALNLDLILSGFQSTASFGSLMFNPLMTGFQSTVTSGSPTILLNIATTGFQSTVSAGTPLLTLDITPSGFQSTGAFGTTALTLQIEPSGTAVTLTFGTPTIDLGVVTVSPTGFSIGPTFGTALLTLDITPTGLAVTVSSGTPSVTSPQDISVSGFQSAITSGTPELVRDLGISGFQSAVTFGTAVAQEGDMYINATGFTVKWKKGGVLIVRDWETTAEGSATWTDTTDPSSSIWKPRYN